MSSRGYCLSRVIRKLSDFSQVYAQSNMATATASGASGTTLLGKGGLSMFNMPTAGRPNFSTRATSCALLTVSVICVCVLVVCGVMIVREYALAKGYKASMCSVVSVANANEISCMFCGAGPKDKNKEKGSGACLWSRFPCLHVRVKYDVNGRETTGLLHPDSLQAASPYSQVRQLLSFFWTDGCHTDVTHLLEYLQWVSRIHTHTPSVSKNICL